MLSLRRRRGLVPQLCIGFLTIWVLYSLYSSNHLPNEHQGEEPKQRSKRLREDDVIHAQDKEEARLVHVKTKLALVKQPVEDELIKPKEDPVKHDPKEAEIEPPKPGAPQQIQQMEPPGSLDKPGE